MPKECHTVISYFFYTPNNFRFSTIIHTYSSHLVKFIGHKSFTMIFIINKVCFPGVRRFWSHGILPVQWRPPGNNQDCPIGGGVGEQPKQPLGIRWHASLLRSRWEWDVLCNLPILEIEVISVFVFYEISHSSSCPHWTLMVFLWEFFTLPPFLGYSSPNRVTYYFWLMQGIQSYFNINTESSFFVNFSFILWVISLECGRGQDISTYACNILS